MSALAWFFLVMTFLVILGTAPILYSDYRKRPPK